MGIGINSPPVYEQREGRPAGLNAHLNCEIVGRLSFYGDVAVVVDAVPVVFKARAGVIREFIAAALRAERDMMIVQARPG